MAKPNCSIPECGKPHLARGMCSKHYWRTVRYGSPDFVNCIVNDPEKSLWSRVEKTDACWIFTGSTNDLGYGHLRVNGKSELAHRYSFFLAHGYWPNVCRHSCDNPPCVNPDHLSDGTNADNVRDMIERGRDRKARGSKAGQAKLNESDVLTLRGLAREGLAVKDIAERFGITPTCVHYIVKRRSWTHI